MSSPLLPTKLAASPPNWATYTGMAQLRAPMTRTRDYLPRSFTPWAGPTSGKSPLNSQRIIVDTREPWPRLFPAPTGGCSRKIGSVPLHALSAER